MSGLPDTSLWSDMKELFITILVVTMLFGVDVLFYYPDNPLDHAFTYALMPYAVAAAWRGAERSLERD